MNFRTGLFRLWALVTIFWIIGFGYYVYSQQLMTSPVVVARDCQYNAPYTREFTRPFEWTESQVRMYVINDLRARRPDCTLISQRDQYAAAIASDFTQKRNALLVDAGITFALFALLLPFGLAILVRAIFWVADGFGGSRAQNRV